MSPRHLQRAGAEPDGAMPRPRDRTEAMARFVHRHPYAREHAHHARVWPGIAALFAVIVGIFGLLFWLLITLLQAANGAAITPQGLLHNPNALVLLVVGALALSVSWVGFLLMVLAVLLLAVDVRMPTHGVLTVTGLLSFVAGSLIFFDSGAAPGGPTVSPFLIWSVAGGMGFIALMVIRYAVRSQHGRTTAGGDGLIGQTAVVLEPLAPVGRLRVLGEIWSAELDEVNKSIGIHAEVASSVRIVARDGLKLIVEPLSYD